MENTLRKIYQSFVFPVGIMTTTVIRDSGLLKKGDFRGSTISSFRIEDEKFCIFGYNRSRIMETALDKLFAFHYLHIGQIDLANKFASHKMTCEEQFKDTLMTVKHGLPILNDYHSLIIGEVLEKYDVGEGFFYLAHIISAEIREDKKILHYSDHKYI